MVAAISWVDRAACIGIDPEIFFPDETDKAAVRAAREICNSCPVREICLTWAVGEGITHGMFGGQAASERRKQRTASRVGTGRQRSDVKSHGSVAAVKRHERKHEKLCDLCKPVKRELGIARRARKRKAREALKETA